MTEPPNPRCEELLGSLSAYLDGDLDPALCRELEQHFAECENCRIVFNTTKRTLDLVQTPLEKPDLPTDVRERLFKRLHLDDYLSPKSK